MKSRTARISRRRFLGTTGATVAAFHIVPHTAWGANEKVNVGCVGAGGRAASDIGAVAGTGMANIVALCDLDHNRAGRTLKKFPQAKKYHDFRKMLEEMKNEIDAVTVAVPDHSHFCPTILAMSMGKHVYVEKPLVHSFREAELLMKAEKKYKVVTQMGNQGHTSTGSLQFKTWVERGIMKDVTRIETWKGPGLFFQKKAVSTWPEPEPVPEGLDWDLWCGPAEKKPFSKMFHPFNWRGYYLYGCGMLGDWGAHIIDFPHDFLKLGLPSEIECVELKNHNQIVFPMYTKLKFHFPARGEGFPAVDMTWTDGAGCRPKIPEGSGIKKLGGNGKMICGKDLWVVGGTHSATSRVYPDAKAAELKEKLTLGKTARLNHHASWVKACKGEGQTWSPFSKAGVLTQVLLLGVVSQYLNASLKLDLKTKRFVGNDKANELLDGPTPRKGWEQFYKLA